VPNEACGTDLALIRRSAAGDRDAFDALAGRHGAAVYRYALAICHDPSAAEDALQETFLAAWRGAAGFRGEQGARAWILAIARNAVARRFRRRAGEPHAMEPLDALGRTAGWGDETSPESIALARERADLIGAALAALVAEDREVLVLRDLEELSGEEAARILDIGLPALKSRLHRARLRFMARLRELSR
jgi:RNA polymerase sigma-70 factor, ECF subfamily